MFACRWKNYENWKKNYKKNEILQKMFLKKSEKKTLEKFAPLGETIFLPHFIKNWVFLD